MKKCLFCDTDLMVAKFSGNVGNPYREEFLSRILCLCLDGHNDLYFISHDQNTLNLLNIAMKEKGYTHFQYLSREEAVDRAKANPNACVFIGNKDIDFQNATNTKVMFICTTWLPVVEEKAKKYGFCAETPEEFFGIINIMNIHEDWYAHAELDNISECISLMDARTFVGAKTETEKEMLTAFQNLLKNGTHRNYYGVLFMYFIASICASSVFNDIELFGMMPSSNCGVNEDIFRFMEQMRYILKKQIPRELMGKPHSEQNLLIRYKEKPTMHGHSQIGRDQLGGVNEFNTLIINPAYKNKIDRLKKQERFNVIIFDDYMNYGNGFNAVRCMLESIGVNKILFVSMGCFRQEFYRKDYVIEGDVFQRDGYAVSLEDERRVQLVINQSSHTEIQKLYNMVNKD